MNITAGMFDCADLEHTALEIHVTSECRRDLLEPLLWQLREERCAHLWQPSLAGAPSEDSYRIFQLLLSAGRPCRLFTYYVCRGGRDEALAVGTISPRLARYLPEDGILVLGRTYVRQEYRGRSVYAQVLRHRLAECVSAMGSRLLGVHIGTSSSRIETVFRSSFPGRVVHIGNEDLGEAGVVAALIGLTSEFDRQVGLPVPEHLLAQHQVLRAYLTDGTDGVTVVEARKALRSLSECQDAYRIFSHFLEAMTDLN